MILTVCLNGVDTDYAFTGYPGDYARETLRFAIGLKREFPDDIVTILVTEEPS